MSNKAWIVLIWVTITLMNTSAIFDSLELDDLKQRVSVLEEKNE